jgi:hypothetical protein
LLLTTGDSRAFDSIRGRHGYVLTFENVSNAQWIGGPQDAASSAPETSTRIRDFDE